MRLFLCSCVVDEGVWVKSVFAANDEEAQRCMADMCHTEPSKVRAEEIGQGVPLH